MVPDPVGAGMLGARVRPGLTTGGAWLARWVVIARRRGRPEDGTVRRSDHGVLELPLYL